MDERTAASAAPVGRRGHAVHAGPLLERAGRPVRHFVRVAFLHTYEFKCATASPLFARLWSSEWPLKMATAAAAAAPLYSVRVFSARSRRCATNEILISERRGPNESAPAGAADGTRRTASGPREFL